MPESLKTMLIWDGSQKNFTTFEDKVFERLLDGNGGRIAQQWYMVSDASITEHNLEEFGNTLWSMQRLKVGIKKADEDAYTDAFWTIECAESWRESHSDSFFSWLTTHTTGDILAIVKTLGRDDVWKLRGQIYEGYGAGTTEDIEELEKEFDKAEFKGGTMQLSDSMPEYLVWVTKKQSDLVDKIPEESRPGYQYFGPSALAKTIIKTIPSDYITTVQTLKQNSMVLAKIAALENLDDPPVE
jgi:hypothetical protein